MFGHEEIGYLIAFIIGLSFILFRRRFAKMFVNQWRKNPKAKKQLDNIVQQNGTANNFFKIYEIALAVLGIFFILDGISGFFPTLNTAITQILFFFVLTLFSVAIATIIEFLLIFNLIWKNVKVYMQEHDLDFFGKYNPTMNSKIVTSDMQSNDPVLRQLRQRAIIRTIACFVLLFVLVFAGLYTLVKMTM